MKNFALFCLSHLATFNLFQPYLQFWVLGWGLKFFLLSTHTDQQTLFSQYDLIPTLSYFTGWVAGIFETIINSASTTQLKLRLGLSLTIGQCKIFCFRNQKGCVNFLFLKIISWNQILQKIYFIFINWNGLLLNGNY